MRLHLIVLPNPNSKSEVELARVNMLEAPNYDDYLFEGRAYYDTNEVSVSILTHCDGNLTKMLGVNVNARSHDEFTRFCESARPPYAVNIDDVDKNPYVQLSLCIESNLVDCPVQA